MFYLTKPISEGPPSEDCTEAMIKSLTDNYTVAAITCIGTMAFWAAFLATLPNCCGKKSQSRTQSFSHKGKHYELSEEI